MAGFAPFGGLVFGQIPEADDYSVKDPFWRLLQINDPQLRYLVELYPWRDDKVVDVFWLPGPIGSVAFGQRKTQTFGAVDPVYLSDHRFITEPDDELDNQYFAPVINNPLQYDMSIIRGSQIGFNTPTFGSIEIVNGDGELDYLLGRKWKGRRIVVKAGVEGFRYADYATVFDGLCNSIEFDERTITLTVGDKGLRLDKEIIAYSYAGTGGLEGGDDIVGRLKPLAYGKCYNIEPVLVDAVNLIYQANDGTMQAFDAVFDSGVALVFDADYADINSAVPAHGKYATCLAKGYLKLGSTPAGRITCDVRGDNGGGYVSKLGDICVRMVTSLYDQERESFTLDDIDTASVAKLNASVAGDMGIYIKERSTVRQLLDKLLNPCAAYWYFNRTGLFALGAVNIAGVPDSTKDIDVIDASGLEMVNVIPATWRITVAYAPVWTVQGEDELAGATSDSQRTFVSNQYRLTTSENRAVRSATPEAEERIFYTNLSEKEDAEALLARLVNIYGTERRVYRGVVYGGIFGVYIGDTAQLSYPRFNINQPMVVMSLSQDAETASTTMEFWG